MINDRNALVLRLHQNIKIGSVVIVSIVPVFLSFQVDVLTGESVPGSRSFLLNSASQWMFLWLLMSARNAELSGEGISGDRISDSFNFHQEGGFWTPRCMVDLGSKMGHWHPGDKVWLHDDFLLVQQNPSSKQNFNGCFCCLHVTKIELGLDGRRQ